MAAERVFLKDWLGGLKRACLAETKRAAATIERHSEGLLNFFVHRITNALSEGFNSRIQHPKAAARGFRNFANYRSRILFFLVSLNLVPAPERRVAPSHRAAKQAVGRDARHVIIDIEHKGRGKKQITTLSHRLERDKLRQAWRREGRYLLRSNMADTDPARLWQFYPSSPKSSKPSKS